MATIKNAKRIVVKVGTSTLTYENGQTNLRIMSKLAQVLSDLKNSGKEIILVTSGAIAVGAGKLGLSERPRDTKGRQAAAAVGQLSLMSMYDRLFSEYGQTVAQLLLNSSDVKDPERKQNLINTFEQLLAFGIVPIINENDSVAIEELFFGDNDSLSATVAVLVKADALVILTDMDGLFNADPRVDSQAKLIPLVTQIDDSLKALAGSNGTPNGTGGMVTKLTAAEIATAAGIDCVIINGRDPADIYKLTDGHQFGTFFTAQKRG